MIQSMYTPASCDLSSTPKGLFTNYVYKTMSPILGQLLNLISPAKINLFDPRFESYDP